jgi:hypothetical protein
MTGTAGQSVCLYYIFDKNDTLVGYGKNSPGGVIETTDSVRIPAGGAKLCVNGRTGASSISRMTADFVRSDGENEGLVGENTNGTNWTAGTGKIKNHINLAGSNNKTVSYIEIQRNGSTFKNASDDITPLNIQGIGYIGANHGYLFVYTATLENHGLTKTDIGKSCTIDGETWVLLQVNSSTFTVGCIDDSAWFGLKTVETPPTTFNFGTSITATSIVLSQLYPSVKNAKVSVKENTREAFSVAESYDIINPKTGIAAIRANTDNYTNDSVALLSDSIITVRNLYTFFPNGSCVITQNVKMLDDSIVLRFYGGTQSSAFGSSDYFAVPMTDKSAFTAAGSSSVQFGKTTWDDQEEPPIIYLQIDNAIGSATKMMVQGIIVKNRNALISNSGGFISGAKKMYPYAIQPETDSEEGYTYGVTSFRLPMYKNDEDANVRFAGYCKVNGSLYWIGCNNVAAEKTIAVPTELCGRSIATVVAKNAVCQNELIATGIDIRFSGAGYILLKID